MKTTMTGALKLLAVMVILASTGPLCALAAPNDMEDVRTVVAAFATTWNNHDMDAFGKLFAVDADFVNVAGTRWAGRKEIQLRHAYAHGTIPENSVPDDDPKYYGIFRHSTMTLARMDVRFLRKDVALAHANCELVGDARTQDVRHCVLTFVLIRQNEGWLIAAAQNTEIGRTVK